MCVCLGSFDRMMGRAGVVSVWTAAVRLRRGDLAWVGGEAECESEDVLSVAPMEGWACDMMVLLASGDRPRAIRAGDREDVVVQDEGRGC